MNNKINNEKSGKFPSSYLGVSLEIILKNIDWHKEFEDICDNFTNKNYLNVIIMEN